MSAWTPPPPRQTGEPAIIAEDLGVRYDLRFTRKTTIRASLGQMLGRGSGGVLGAPARVAAAPPRRIAHRSEWRRQVDAPPGPRGDHPAVAGLGRRPRARVRSAHVGRRVRPGPDRPRQHPARRRVPRPRRRGHPCAHARDHRIRRARRVHRRADQDLLLGHARRLGFAIATSVDPDILLLDEVLATGDAAFRAKSKERVIEIVRAAKRSCSSHTT